MSVQLAFDFSAPEPAPAQVPVAYLRENFWSPGRWHIQDRGYYTLPGADGTYTRAEAKAVCRRHGWQIAADN